MRVAQTGLQFFQHREISLQSLVLVICQRHDALLFELSDHTHRLVGRPSDTLAENLIKIVAHESAEVTVERVRSYDLPPALLPHIVHVLLWQFAVRESEASLHQGFSLTCLVIALHVADVPL